MTTFFEYLTIICLALPVYVYVGYPLLLIFLSKVLPLKKVNKSDITPSVSLLVSCYNEVDVVREKIENCLNIDYPEALLDIVFISDGSDDGTDDVIKEYTDKNIRLIRQEGRLGKTSAINQTMPEISSDIVVFSDANAMYEPDAIRKLVRNFNDAEVGYVVGAALYTDGAESSAAQSEDAYWKYEVYLKEIESQLHSVVGGDGAIYAIRRALYEPLLVTDINDFVNPLQIIAKGYRGVFEKEAICYEETAGEFEKEARRKERIVNRSFRGLMRVKEVLNPFKVGFYSLEIISHKLLRWLIPVFLIGAVLGASLLTIAGNETAKILLLLEIIFFWLVTAGYVKSSASKISPLFFYPYYFVMVNYHSLIGVLKALQGQIQVTWSTSRAMQQGGVANSGMRNLIVGGNIYAIFMLGILLVL